jgi:hypothetical protein
MPGGLPHRPLGLGDRVRAIKFPNKNQKKSKKGQKSLTRISGHGDYKQVLKTVGAALRPVAKEAILNAGSALGGLAGSRLGSSSGGAKVGRTLAAKLSRMFGCGDYVVNERPVSNSLLKGGGNQYATFGNNGQSTRIQHREYLFDLAQGATAGVFSNTSFSVNPGVLASFPYLAPIAANFEEYRINGLVYEFISTTSPYFAGGAMGSVIMSMQYNPIAPVFTSKIQMENSDFAISARPDQSMVYGVECASNTQNMYLIRQGTSSAPLTATDLGIMQIAVQSPIAAGVVLGEVWVSYDIELLRPKAQVAGAGWLHVSGTGLAVGTAPSITTTQASLGALSGSTYVNVGGGVATVTLPSLPSGTAVCVSLLAKYAGATAAAGGISCTATGAVTAAALGNGVSLDTTSAVTSLSVGSSMLVQDWIVSGSAVFTFNVGVAPAGTTTHTIDYMVNVIGYGLSAVTI